MKTFYGALTIATRSDACCYLQYLVDMTEGKYNRYRCGLLYPDNQYHKCQHWGWCPMWEKSQKEKKELELEQWDLRDFPVYKYKEKEYNSKQSIVII
jgi:hypothetical protein